MSRTIPVAAVVPVHRGQATVAHAVASLLVHPPDLLERVVVVASPADGSASVAAAFDDPRVVVVRTDARLDAGAARNLGRTLAPDGCHLLFLDADCRIARGALARLVDRLDDPSVSAVGGAVTCVGTTWTSWLRHELEFKDYDGRRPAGGRVGFVPSALLLCRAEAFDRVGGFPDLWPGEDLVLCARLRAASGAVVFEPSAVAKHRHPSGVAELLRHQRRLGATAARARAAGAGPGRILWRRPALALLLWPARTLRLLASVARHRRRRLARLALLWPLAVTALGVWTFAFALEAGAGRRRG